MDARLLWGSAIRAGFTLPRNTAVQLLVLLFTNQGVVETTSLAEPAKLARRRVMHWLARTSWPSEAGAQAVILVNQNTQTWLIEEAWSTWRLILLLPIAKECMK